MKRVVVGGVKRVVVGWIGSIHRGLANGLLCAWKRSVHHRDEHPRCPCFRDEVRDQHQKFFEVLRPNWTHEVNSFKTRSNRYRSSWTNLPFVKVTETTLHFRWTKRPMDPRGLRVEPAQRSQERLLLRLLRWQRPDWPVVLRHAHAFR